jgi:conjugative relaxase-like TrwC/TraI family protein
MLQITPITAGQSAAKWEYYAQEYSGVWGGMGAELLGLSGEVTRQEFNALANNKMPGMRVRLTLRTKANRLAGYDCCFDVPKSLSIYISETGDNKVKRLIQEAARETMSDIEMGMETTVRKGNAKKNRSTRNVIYAAFVHTSGRPVKGVTDPQYHVHFYVTNATYDREELRWKAGQFGKIKKNAPQYQTEYHERLISKLRANGYRIRRTEHAFELSSISRELIEKFSKRTAVIKEAARARHDEIKKRAQSLVKHAKMTFEKAVAAIKGRLGQETRERKPRKKLSAEEHSAYVRSQMTPSERDSVRQAMPQQQPALTRPRAIMSERMRPQMEIER